MTPLKRTCTQCNIEKPVDDFYRNTRHARTYRYSCKECDKAKARDRRLPATAQRLREKRERDREVLDLITQSVPIYQIAARVGVTKATVKNITRRSHTF